MKRLVCVLLVVVMVFSLAACGENTPARGTTEADKAYLADVQKRIEDIRSTPTDITYTGTAYYVSNDGSDDNNGLSPETAWASLAPVNGGDFRPGDAVLFRRGDIFRGNIWCQEGVTYSAYGEGDKPRLYGSPESGVGAEKWSLFYDENGVKLWKYHRTLQDCGGIVFNDGASYASRVFSYWNGEKAVVHSDHTQDFDMVAALEYDLQFYCDYPADIATKSVPFAAFDTELYGDVYLRCDAGNPGELYESIEFQCTAEVVGYCGIFQGGDANSFTVDNLCAMYSNTMAFASGGGDNITIQNCEAAFVGGGSHIIGHTDPFSPSACVPVSGEGIRLDGYNNKAVNNYVHDCFDGGIIFEPDLSFELSDGAIDENMAAKQWGNTVVMGNVIEKCMSGVLIGVHCEDSVTPQVGDITISDNDILNCGYGWSGDEHFNFTWRTEDYDGNAITFWDDDYPHGTFLVENNRLYVGKASLIHHGYSDENMPVFRGNTYAQNAGGYIVRGVEACTSSSDEKTLSLCAKYLDDTEAKTPA